MAMNNVYTSELSMCIEGGYYFKQRVFDQTLNAVFRKLGISSIKDFRQRSVILDWSSTYYHDLGTLLWSVVLLHEFKKQDCRILLKLPNAEENMGERVWSFLKKWKFFEALNSCVDHPANLLSDAQLPWLGKESRYSTSMIVDPDGNVRQLYTGKLLEITNFLLQSESEATPPREENQEVLAYVDRWKGKVVTVALKNLCGWSEDVADAFVMRVVSEGLFNSVVHAKGSFLLVAMKVDNKNLHLAVADNGKGVPDTLRSAFARSSKLQNLVRKTDSELISYYTKADMILDSQLIRLSTRRGTSSQAARAGFGLYYLKKVVLDHGGELRIRSGRACVDFSSDKGEEPVDRLVKSPGTMLRILMPRRS